MVLGNPGALKAISFRSPDLLQRKSISLSGRDIIQKAGKKTELFLGHGPDNFQSDSGYGLVLYEIFHNQSVSPAGNAD